MIVYPILWSNNDHNFALMIISYGIYTGSVKPCYAYLFDMLIMAALCNRVARWCNGKAFGLAISRSQVQILLEATLRNDLRQVVYTYVFLSPSSITWYRPKGGDALRLGR